MSHYWFNTRAEARRAIFAWTNRYNSRRRRSTLGYIAPIGWEQNYHQSQGQPVGVTYVTGKRGSSNFHQ